MRKKYYRFFGGLLHAQENWLNRMAQKGYRLVRTEKLLYEFEPCESGQMQYRVEFIGEKAKEKAQDYRFFLEDLGYQVFYKNINLNYSVGKVRYRPWAEPGGRIATNSTTFNRELLIVGKENDGKPFELHTSLEDKLSYCRNLRNPWLCFALLFGFLGIMNYNIVFLVGALLNLIIVLIYQVQITALKREAKTKE
ncbi:DUF2812 domain-containing protein [Anaerolentibacter hominis]|uniref:DUF2812 domain-containing protein n=1 Tax=Anaerolentibacter hominis TaxID=3079009 RepID=UPI0031B800C6